MIAQRYPGRSGTTRDLVRAAVYSADPSRTAPVNLLLASSAALLFAAVILAMTSGIEQLLALAPLVALLCFLLWWIGGAVREERHRERLRDERLDLAREVAVSVLLGDSSPGTQQRLAAELLVGESDLARLHDLGEQLLDSRADDAAPRSGSRRLEN